MIPQAKPTVMFLSDMCLLDRNSGAAIEMLDWMKFLASENYAACSVTMSLFDGAGEYPMRQEIMPTIDPSQHIGKRIRLTLDGIEHNIFNVGTSSAKRIGRDQIAGFIKSAAEDIRRVRPDVVIGYGSTNLVPLRKLARDLGARSVFYLANDSYTEEKRGCFAETDVIITPSQALADMYRDRLGLSANVIRNFLPDYDGLERPSQLEIEDRCRRGFVTMINPSLNKGGLHFLQVVAAMEKLEPDLTFLAVESRMSRLELEAIVNNSSKLRNLWWLPRQEDLHRVYRKSVFVLVPSLWFEAAGRVVAEAQLHGVPVIAHRVGALPEQLGDGGELIEVPQRLQGHFAELPSVAEVAPWVSAIRESRKKKRYLDLVKQTLGSGQRHSPLKRRQELLEFFSSEVSAAKAELAG